MHTVTNNAVSETTTGRIVTVNMSKINATVKLHVKRG